MRRYAALLSCALVPVFGAPAPVSAQPSAPACRQVVQGFYTWYASSKGGDYAAVRAKPQLFSAQLVQMMAADQAAELKSHKLDGLDFDPFINAQMAPRRIVVGNAAVSGNACRVPIFMDYGGTTMSKPHVTALLTPRSGRWIFTDFTFDNGGSLVKTLQTLKAQRAKYGA